MEKFIEYISAILSSMRRAFVSGCITFLSCACALVASESSQNAQSLTPSQSQKPNPAKPAPPSSSLPQQTGQGQALPPQTAPPIQQPVTLPETLRGVVIDPAHGGPDTGARSASGVAEKDIVLEFARELAAALQAEGFSIVMTRQGNMDPTPDDRATIANGQSDEAFISLHVASSGPPGTVRTYSYLFPATIPALSATPVNPGTQPANSIVASTISPTGILVWQKAQKPFVEQSRKLGDLIQAELAQKFNGSPQVSWSAPVFALRSVTAPAVAVEVSNITANPQQLEAMAAPLAQGIARAVATYKAMYAAGGR